MERLKRMSVFRQKVVELGSSHRSGPPASDERFLDQSDRRQTGREDEPAGAATQPQHPQPWLN